MDIKKKIPRKKAEIDRNNCVACGTCIHECPVGAIKIIAGVYAEVDKSRCVGCGKCERVCPASVIQLLQEVNA